ncbi:molecular chaperone DnaJ [Nitrosomonas sp.]|uniref:molecular chaperone DnaJ n=1 Tax=Nitrosomonas sp. TaxID=42353 RepID=UPI001DFC6922|nr:molecular chaperone DnaJ [Nitrosomonas sp.]MBX3617392.1 molecular chaperone DnaJ [Nitrosomonas sp.]
MIERRNYYRILHVQPDAPMTVIDESYRIWMQKLKTYPELENADWNADLLNLAFNTLRDPYKRIEYDRELLKRYHIKVLSQGALGAPTVNPGVDNQHAEGAVDFKQRNYYRILQVQADAPITTITASYWALRKNSPNNHALLDEAYRILSNPASRKHYDALLVSDLWQAAKEDVRAKKEQFPALFETIASSARSSIEPYRAVITHYCSFCKTPYVSRIGFYQNENCLECGSPLAAFEQGHLESPFRTLTRINVRGQLTYYLFWPGRPCQGIFQDLSPAGIRFLTNVMLDRSDIIKIDAPNFQAVAEVTHTRQEGGGFSIGTRFLAAKFDQRHGNFVSLQV